jgi:arginyl-tRNA synthetase
MTNIFEKEIADLLKKELKLKEISLEIPPNPNLGDYAFPCFSLAKQFRKNPVEIAKELAAKIKPTGFIREIKEIGPYLNFFIDKQKLAGTLIKEILAKKEKFGSGKKKKERIMVEFSQANTHKAFHIGHVRNICLGIALSNVLEFSGYKVIRANYQGDIGPHVVKCLWGLMHFNDKAPKENRLRWLGEIYAKANKKISGDEKLEAEIREMTKSLYDGDKKLTSLWKETRQWCLDDFDKIYSEFEIKFDNLFFESEVEKAGIKIVKAMLEKGLAKVSDGALIIDLEYYGLGIFLLLRSDGVALYSTKDIALAKEKFEKYKIDRSIYVVGSEQELHFKQLFKTFEIMGFKQASKCYHLSYGLVMLPEGKMSSREGTVILYDDLKDKLYEAAKKGINERHRDWTKEDTEKGKHSLVFSALKFGMVSRETNKSILFDWDTALAFEGETGPYIQYAHARICSILRKYNGKMPARINYSLLNAKEEEGLLNLLSQFPEKVEESAEHYRPYVIAKYLIELAQLFNEYYHAQQILQASKGIMEARIKLISSVKQVLANGLNLLGIDAPERM